MNSKTLSALLGIAALSMIVYGYRAARAARVALAAAPAVSRSSAQLEDKVAALERELHDKEALLKALQDQVDLLKNRKPAEVPATNRPVVVQPSAIPVPVFFPQTRRPLATATLYWRKSTNQNGLEAWFPMVVLPPQLRYSFTRYVTNTIERSEPRQVSYSYHYYPYYYPYYPFIYTPAALSSSNVTAQINAAAPQGRLFPPPLPRFGNNEGFPPPLPRFGLKKP